LALDLLVGCGFGDDILEKLEVVMVSDGVCLRGVNRGMIMGWSFMACEAYLGLCIGCCVVACAPSWPCFALL